MTQLESARAGLITKEMKYCAEFEGIELEKLRKLVAEGKVVIPRNKITQFKKASSNRRTDDGKSERQYRHIRRIFLLERGIGKVRSRVEYWC